MATDIQKLFNETLPQTIAQHPDKARSLGAKFQINITGDGGGEWNIDCASAAPACKKGTGPADVTITIATPDAQKLFDDPNSGMSLFFSGKLKVSGNQMLAMKLGELKKLGD